MILGGMRRRMRAPMESNAQRLAVAALCMLLVLFLNCSRTSAAQAPPVERASTTVILVRHAEKAAEPASDPGLSPAGEQRSRDLVQLARDAGVTAIITTQFARTRATAQPLATALGVKPDIVDARGTTHPQDVANAIRMHAGASVLVVGHSNTIPAIIAALGAPQPPPICDAEYDNVYIVTLPASGTPRVIRARYGAPTPVSDGCASMR
jgi:broad specificity phosphatase PhoE